MTKSNDSTKNFIKSNSLQKDIKDIKEKPFFYIIQLVGLLIVILNIWLAAKLAPLSKSLAVVVTRVDAVEKEDTQIIERIDRIESKVDILLAR